MVRHHFFTVILIPGPEMTPQKQAFFSLSEGWVNPNFEEKQGFFRVRHTTARSGTLSSPGKDIKGHFKKPSVRGTGMTHFQAIKTWFFPNKT
jgi:hypothetical protein